MRMQLKQNASKPKEKEFWSLKTTADTNNRMQSTNTYIQTIY